jgi:hypothetical protein
VNHSGVPRRIKVGCCVSSLGEHVASLVCQNTHCKIPHVTHCRWVRGHCRSSVFLPSKLFRSSCVDTLFIVRPQAAAVIDMMMTHHASCSTRHDTAPLRVAKPRLLGLASDVALRYPPSGRPTVPSHRTSDHTVLPILPPASHSPTPGPRVPTLTALPLPPPVS